MRFVVDHVALLAESHEILDPIVGDVLVDVMDHQGRSELRSIPYDVNPDPLQIAAGDALMPVSIQRRHPHHRKPKRPALAVLEMRIARPGHPSGVDRRRTLFAAILYSRMRGLEFLFAFPALDRLQFPRKPVAGATLGRAESIVPVPRHRLVARLALPGVFHRVMRPRAFEAAIELGVHPSLDLLLVFAHLLRELFFAKPTLEDHVGSTDLVVARAAHGSP